MRINEFRANPSRAESNHCPSADLGNVPGGVPLDFHPDGSGIAELEPVRNLIKKHGDALVRLFGGDPIIELAAIAISEPVKESYRYRTGAEEIREAMTPRPEPTTEALATFADSHRRKGI